MDDRLGAGAGRRARVAAVAAALAAILPLHARAGCSLQLVELPVKMIGHRAIAMVGIDAAQVPLIVDTGGFFSMLTESAASQLHLELGPMPFGTSVMGLAGKVETHATRVAHLKLAGTDIPDAQFIVGGNEPGAGAMGLMGRNLMSFTDMEFDLAHGVIRYVYPSDGCKDADMAYWAGNTPVATLDLEHRRGDVVPEIRATIKLDGHAVTAVFDSGADTVVSLATAHRLGLKDGDMTPAGKATGVGAGRVDEWNATFDTVDLGGETIRHNRLSVAEFDMGQDMLVGIDFFLAHRIYISKKQARMFFTYNGGPVFALNVGARASPEAEAASAAAPGADQLARRGAASQARGDLAGALADLDRACALAPDNAEFLAMRASVQFELKHPDLALADLDAALRLAPTLDDARLQRAGLLEQGHERDRGLDDLAALDQRLAPQSALRLPMANLYESLGQHAQAVAQWSLWIPAHPHDIGLDEAYNNRCWARVELGIELDKALDDCDKAVDADGKNAAYLDSRAWAFLRLGRWHRADSEFGRALAASPGLASSLYGRSLARRHLDDPAAADADLAAARQAQPGIDADIARSGLPIAGS